MPYSTSAPAHSYDHEAILCACGYCVGYRKARTKDPLHCVKCDALFEPGQRVAPRLPANAQAFVDAWDNAAARAALDVTSAQSNVVAVPRSLFDAVAAARAALPKT